MGDCLDDKFVIYIVNQFDLIMSSIVNRSAGFAFRHPSNNCLHSVDKWSSLYYKKVIKFEAPFLNITFFLLAETICSSVSNGTSPMTSI